MLGGSVAVALNRSINTLPSTTSPTNTKRQTKSMPSSKATRRRPTPSEPRVTRPRRRVSDFHTRSLCRMDIVPSIRNAACPQTRPNAMFSIARTYRAESGRSKIPADKTTAPAMIGHLARSKSSRWGILRATHGLRSSPERHIGDRCIPPHHPFSLPAAQRHHDRRREAAVERHRRASLRHR